MRGIERSWQERSKILEANKVCRLRVQKKQANFYLLLQAVAFTSFQASSPSRGIGYRETSRETRGPPRSPTRRRGLVRRLAYLSRTKFVTKEGPRPRQPKQYSIYYRGDNATPHIFSFSEATVKIQQIRSSVDVSVEAL